MSNGIIGAITSVMDAVFTWLGTALQSVIAIFYAEGALTFLGTLALISLAIGLFFLLVGVISSFLHLRG